MERSFKEQVVEVTRQWFTVCTGLQSNVVIGAATAVLVDVAFQSQMNRRAVLKHVAKTWDRAAKLRARGLGPGACPERES